MTPHDLYCDSLEGPGPYVEHYWIKLLLNEVVESNFNSQIQESNLGVKYIFSAGQVLSI